MNKTITPVTSKRLTNLKTELCKELDMWHKTSPQYIAIRNVIDICNTELERLTKLDRDMHIIP